MKVIIFGAGHTGKRFCNECSDDVEIIAFADNDPDKVGTYINGHIVIMPDLIPEYEYDKIVIAVIDYSSVPINNSYMNSNSILLQLYEYGIPRSKIFLTAYNYVDKDRNRVEFIRKYSELIYLRTIPGAAAECGVFRGHYAAFINKYLHDRTLYLFDTFTGFDKRDIEKEKLLESSNPNVESIVDWANTANADISMIRCLYQENVVIKQGYVPETFIGLEEEKFCFVSLDMDLYEPMLASLRFFAPRMSQGGVILVHEYYCNNFTSVKTVVEDFSKEYGITTVPIGDKLSIAVIPHQ